MNTSSLTPFQIRKLDDLSKSVEFHLKLYDFYVSQSKKMAVEIPEYSIDCSNNAVDCRSKYIQRQMELDTFYTSCLH